mgnify:FL=1
MVEHASHQLAEENVRVIHVILEFRVKRTTTMRVQMNKK